MKKLFVIGWVSLFDNELKLEFVSEETAHKALENAPKLFKDWNQQDKKRLLEQSIEAIRESFFDCDIIMNIEEVPHEERS